MTVTNDKKGDFDEQVGSSHHQWHQDRAAHGITDMVVGRSEVLECDTIAARSVVPVGSQLSHEESAEMI